MKGNISFFLHNKFTVGRGLLLKYFVVPVKSLNFHSVSCKLKLD